MKLSQRSIIAVEQAILSDKLNLKDIFETPCISLQYYDRLREMWLLIQTENINSYYQFASNGNGTQSYGFYKANNGKIYIIEAFINEITKVYVVSKNFHFIRDLIKDEEIFQYE